MNCPYCGADNREKAKFCRLCAKRIDKQEVEVVSPAAKPAITKAGSTTTASKKIAYVAIPAVFAIAIGGWLLTKHNDHKESDIKPTKVASHPVVPSANATTVAAPHSSIPTTTPTDSTRSTANNNIIPVTPAAALVEADNYSPASVSVSNASSADEKSIAPSPKKEQVKPEASLQIANNKKEDNKAKKLVAKKEAKKVDTNLKDKLKTNEVNSPKPSVASPSSQYQEPKQSPKSSLASELGACKNKSFFAKASCENQVRYKYCADKSDSSPECASPRSSDPSDGRG